MEEFDPIHLKFKHPFNMTVAGPSGCGKTTFVRNFLKYFDTLTTLDVPRLRCLWAHGQWQDTYNKPISEFVDVTYFHGLPSESEVISKRLHILVLDDLMLETSSGKQLISFLSRFSHHNFISVIFLTQNLFYSGKNTTDVNRQSHYTVVYRNSRDKSVAITLAKQLAPYNKRHFYDSFHDATRLPFSYLLIDAHPTTPEELLLKTNVLPSNEEECQCDVYFEDGPFLEELKRIHNAI